MVQTEERNRLQDDTQTAERLLDPGVDGENLEVYGRATPDAGPRHFAPVLGSGVEQVIVHAVRGAEDTRTRRQDVEIVVGIQCNVRSDAWRLHPRGNDGGPEGRDLLWTAVSIN